MYIVNPLVTRGVTRGLNPKKVLQGGQVGTGGVVVALSIPGKLRLTRREPPVKLLSSSIHPPPTPDSKLLGSDDTKSVIVLVDKNYTHFHWLKKQN
jgi:hypothetical protein